ncbi:MAG: hypothetical protein R3224_09015, partial [Balneolaceae bacterium]|nr:hypothetical protein [Balneolaceae bacterium]
HPFQREEMFRRIRKGTDREVDRYPYLAVPEGYMKGYIDLVFEWDGRYFILDYKTNYLGSSPADYAPELLGREMAEAGYDVQYHIYTVALHRFLEERADGYSYDKHFGGIFYLYVRGMGQGAADNGIFFNRPERSGIDQLDALFGREEAV